MILYLYIIYHKVYKLQQEGDFLKILAIITEYNPFHNGHKYQIQKARELTGADFVLVIMSGSFTQQGNICVLNKFDRAKIATLEGADLVLELPTIYATSSAEDFAFGALNILDSLNCIDYLSFGAECSDISVLSSIANKILSSEEKISENISSNIKSGKSFASIRHKALQSILNEEEIEEIEKPNNILGIEYLKALKKLNSTICPVLVERATANHNDFEIPGNASFASSTAVRNYILNSKNQDELYKLSNTIPKSCLAYLTDSNTKLCTNQDMFQILRYKIIDIGKEKLKEIKGVVEGLENRIYKSCIISTSYEELVKNIKSKRFLESRIKRILINILLDISKNTYKELYPVAYARILKSTSASLTKKISNHSKIPVVSSIKPNNIDTLNDKCTFSLNLDIKACNIRDIVASQHLLKDKLNRI